jgi:hypothetical protein
MVKEDLHSLIIVNECLLHNNTKTVHVNRMNMLARVNTKV